MTFGSGKTGQVDARRHTFSLQSLLSSTALLRVCRAVALGLGLTSALPAASAWADCTPVAGNGVTATCVGTTTNQGGGAPGSSAGTDGYGTGVETGVTVNVASGAANTVTGTNSGIFLHDATVINATGGCITGGQFGIVANGGGSSVFNAGTISGGTAAIQFAGTDNTLTLARGSVITGNGLGTGSDTFQLGCTSYAASSDCPRTRSC